MFDATRNKTALIIAIFLTSLFVLPFVALAANFGVGDVAQVVNNGVKVRDNYCLSGNWDGTIKSVGSKGSVLSGSVSCDGYNWWKIRWEDGKEGWSADGSGGTAWLTKYYVTPSTKFAINDRVQAANLGGLSLSVRNDPPNLVWTGSVSEGTQGTVVGGPFYGIPQGSSGFYHFWKVSFGSITGWAAENYLNKVTINPPSPPQNLIATAGDARVDLSWSVPASNGGSAITNYKIYRGTSPGSETLYYTTSTTGTTFQNTLVTNGVTYYYKVTAVNSIGESGFSNEASATPQSSATIPSAPQNLVATAGDGRVDLSWSAPSSNGGSAITNYKIYRGTSPNSETLYYTTSTTGTTFSNTQVTNGVTYYYKVTAVNSVGESGFSNEASATPQASATVPSAPQNLMATAGDSYVDLSWSAPSSNGGSAITNYKIYRGTSSGGESLYYTTGTTGTTFRNTVVTNGITYYFKVTAVNSAGEGPYSNEASATPQSSATIPSAPQNLVATAGNGRVDLSWSAPSSNGGSAITNYKIYRGTSSGGESLYYTTSTTGTTFQNTLVTNGVTYYYKVTAMNSIGESGFSNEASATPQSSATVPSAPQNLIATAGDGRVDLSWGTPLNNGGSPITNYKIYRGTSPGGESLYYTTSTTGTTFTNTAVTNGVTYYYKVTAVNSVGESGYSNEASATPQSSIQLPGMPVHNSPADGFTINTLTPTFWFTKGTNSQTSGIYIRDTDTGVLVFDSERDYGSIPWSSFTLPSGYLQNGHNYRWNMRAFNSAGAGSFTTPWTFRVNTGGGATVPSAPQNLAASAGNGQVSLSWSAPANNGGATITSYKIYRGTSSTQQTYLTSTSSLSYTNTGLTNGQIYYYKISAVNSVGEGAFSNIASATPQGTSGLPGMPIHTSPADGSTITIPTPIFRFTKGVNTDYVALYIRNTDTGVLVFDSERDYGRIPWNSFTLPAGYLQNGGHYRWYMRAFNSAGTSDYTTAWTFIVNTGGGGGSCGDYPYIDECYLLPETVKNYNYEVGSRGTAEINYTVIHTTGIESSFDEASVKSSFTNPNHRASAHYLVTRTGRIVQFVRDKDVPYHAGNYAYNLQSIGIEHEGAANDAGVYTTAMAEASARLVKWLADTYIIPKNRTYIIGHNQIPCPCTDNCPGALPRIGSRPVQCDDAIKHKHTPLTHTDCQYGGIGAKTDPGQYWNWPDYMSRINGGSTCPVIFRTNAASTNYVDGTWVAADRNNDGTLEGYGYTKSSTAVSKFCVDSKSPLLTYTKEGYAVRKYGTDTVLICKPAAYYVYYMPDSDAGRALLSTAPTEPYTSNNQEVTRC